MIIQRLIRFRREMVTLWHAFWHPLTPTYLKVLTVLTVLYVLSPIDIVTDIIPVIGWVDDVIIVSFAVSWIVSRLPRNLQNPPSSERRRPQTRTSNTSFGANRSEKIIEGKARRM